MMATTTFDLEASMKSLFKDGFLDLNDAKVGNLVAEMERWGFPFLSMYGLDYLEKSVLADERIKNILSSSLGHCSLGHWLRYTAFPGHIECFRQGGQEAGLRCVLVEHWPKGSRVNYYAGSHLLDLPTSKGDRSLHETSLDVLLEAGCKATSKEFPDGGLIIRDARLYSENATGYVITFAFATQEVFEAWHKIVIPNSTDLVRKVVNMETSDIKINFAIRDSVAKT